MSPRQTTQRSRATTRKPRNVGSAKNAAQKKEEDSTNLATTTTVPLDKKEDSLAAAKMVPLGKIVMASSQPRRYFDPSAMQALFESVKRDGILMPLLVRPVGNKYELVAGERRYKAAQEVGLTEVPATIREMSESQAVQYALVENLQREDLNPLEETESILQLLALRLGCNYSEVPPLLYRMENEAKGKITRNVSGNESASTVEQVFTELGRMNWQSFVRTRLPLLKLPDNILEALRTGRIEYTKALAIAKVSSDSDRQEILDTAVDYSLSLNEIREKVKALQPPAESGEIQKLLESTYKKVKKSKVWENPDKQERLKSLLAELSALLSTEE
ncbi:chromosome partitioning protein ParB [Scytonema hofmannii PCC 7110]|uniref:Chromosome partitioning protein ParB n=1 Tax=Scytonema hofmannii PCC 7110 TaxID=128403 RepID=A0A139WQB8_9CYAN|nr:ParB/RepB/Spo0J family partition protein [Scytonema hofmannii]KYC34622.1 chromosome partitioning protein ParB [Scytonema hofmannii PCC 7110]